jgi:hypothetical protein
MKIIVEYSRKRSGLTVFSAVSLTIRVAISLDVVGVECQSIVATAVVLSVVLAVVLTVVLTIVLAVVLAIVLTELSLSNTGCEQHRQQSSVTHDEGWKVESEGRLTATRMRM